MAYYYFDFRDVKKQDLYGLLSSLLSQLSAKSDSFYEVLSQLYTDNAGGIGKPDGDALTECLKDMLRLPGHGPIYIIIDALDECPNISGTPSAREEVLVLLKELIDLNLPIAYLCVTSRPEVDIQRVLHSPASFQVSLHDEIGQKEDIIEYIKYFVRSEWNMRKWREEDQKLVIDVLSERADGM
jgi:NACHT domain